MNQRPTTKSTDCEEHSPLLTFDQITDWLAVSRRSIEREISRGVFPRPLKIGRSSRFSRDDVLAYLERAKGDQKTVDATR